MGATAEDASWGTIYNSSFLVRTQILLQKVHIPIFFFCRPLFAPINLLLPKGSSIAIEIDTNTSSGTTNVYAAMVCYLKNKDFEG